MHDLSTLCFQCENAHQLFELMLSRQEAMRRANASIGRGPDLISSLPDSILHHILGFLNTKETVKSCVLSKRWEHLWASVRSLHFDSSDFMQPDNHYNSSFLNRNQLNLEYKIERLACSERFVKFVHAVLLKREPLDLDMFRLSCQQLDREHKEQARDWIHYAVKHRAQVFHLSGCYSLPSCIYTCTSVEELRLTECAIHVSGTVNLPKLRKLVMFYNRTDILFPKNLISGCLILEFLEINYYKLPDELVIASEYLKDLCILDCGIDRLMIDAPNLLSFSFLSSSLDLEYPRPHDIILNMPSLKFSLLDARCFQMSDDLERVTSIMGALSNAEFLNLYIDCNQLKVCISYSQIMVSNAEFLNLYIDCNQLKELHGVQFPELPISQKLKNVIVAFCALGCLEVVAWILNSSPNLQKLTLLEQPCYLDEMEATPSESIDASWMVAITTCKKLEIIEVRYEEERYEQMVGQLIDALINATKELENLKIRSSKYEDF